MLKIILNNIYKDMNPYNFKYYELDIPSIQSTLNKFKDKFSNIENLKQNDKIYFDSSNIIQVTPVGYLQSATRWYYSYNRHEIFEQLSSSIDDYMKFCDMLTFYKDYMQQYETAEHFNVIYNESHNYLSKIVQGVETLMKTYEDDGIMKENLKGLVDLITNKIIIRTIL